MSTKLTLDETTLAYRLTGMMKKFYEDPKNEAGFQEWLKKRRAEEASQPDRAQQPKASTV